MNAFAIIAVMLVSLLCPAEAPTPARDHIKAFFQQLSRDGGRWEALPDTSGQHQFTKFIMKFSQDGPSSIRGQIRGIRTGGDTVAIWDIWEFPDPSQLNKTVLIQRSDWAYGIGTSSFEKDGERSGIMEFTWYNGQHQRHRDTHRFISEDTLTSLSADFNEETGSWGADTQLSWVRKRR